MFLMLIMLVVCLQRYDKGVSGCAEQDDSSCGAA